MLTSRKRTELPGLANNLTQGLELVKYLDVLYIPVDYETLEPKAGLPPERRAWLRLPPEQVIRLANQEQDILFTNDGEARSYVGMVRQIAEEGAPPGDRVLIRTESGLRELQGDGQLHDLTPEFTPYFIDTMLVEDEAAKAEIIDTFNEWLNSEEDATSLLHHLATTLAPSWPAVKYVLLIGEGRNGKSLILTMLTKLLGRHNVSHVTRQQMSAKDQECHDLANKMLNAVFDGEATYLKDAGTEKTLTAGEVASIRRLYESIPTDIQTNGLFIEGLNREPKSSDKSAALQKRIIRYYLPHTYELDRAFHDRMLSPKMLGAFLAVLIDHYVQKDEAATKLAPTHSALEMKLEYTRLNNIAMQFLEWVELEHANHSAHLIDMSIVDVARMFQGWRLRECGDVSTWSLPDVENLLRPLFATERKSLRAGSKVVKHRVITGFRPETTEFLNYIREEDAHASTMAESEQLLDLESAASD